MCKSYRFLMIALAISLAGLASYGGAAGSQRHGRTAKVAPSLGSSENPVPKGVSPLAVQNPDWLEDHFRSHWVGVNISGDDNDGTRRIAEQSATLLSAFQDVPDARLVFFAGYMDIGFARWHGTVVGVAPDDEGGVFVSIAVTPTLKNGGTPLTTGNYLENYHISAQEEITYLGSKDPDGAAGRSSSYVVN